MNDRQLDELLRQAEPAAAARLAALDLRRGGQELLEEIMSTSVTPHNVSPDDPPEAPDDVVPPLIVAQDFTGVRTGGSVGHDRSAAVRSRRRVLIGAATAIAVAAAICAPAIVFRHGHRAELRKVQVTPASRSAPADVSLGSNPLVLIDEPGWKIVHVDQDDDVHGEIQFAHGKYDLQATWYAAREYRDYYQDRLDVSRPKTVQVLGRQAAQFTYSPTDFAAMLPPAGRIFIEIRAGGGDHAEFLAALAALHAVSPQEWLAALPASVVTPLTAAATIEEMLSDVPLPPGFDKSKLPTDRTKDYYQFAAGVVSQVTCGWLDDYGAARKAGDKGEMAKVAEVLTGSRNWVVIQRMAPEGDFGPAIMQYAGQVAKGQRVTDYRPNLCDD